MPRSKPRHTDVLRIELGTKERQQLDDLMIGYQIKSIGTPLVALLSDVSAMSLLFSVYAVYRYGDDALQYLKTEAYDDLAELYRDALNIARDLPVIRQGIAITDLIEQFVMSPSEAGTYDDRWWTNTPSSQWGGRTR